MLLAGMVLRGTSCLRAAVDGVRGRIARYGRFLGTQGDDGSDLRGLGRDVLVIQDTCEVHIKTRAERRRGFGEIGKGNNYGILLHAMVAVDTNTGLCLGLVDGAVRTRVGQRTTCHTERALNDRSPAVGSIPPEGVRWFCPTPPG